MSAGKQNGPCYLERQSNGKKNFQCQLCNRVVTSKRSILTHLNEQHGLSPAKPSKRLYRFNENIAVPRSTLWRWKSPKAKKSMTFGEVIDSSDAVLGPVASSSEPRNDSDNPSNTDPDTDTSDSNVSAEPLGSSGVPSDDSDEDSISSTDTSSIDLCNSEKSDVEKQSEDSKALMLLSCFNKHNLTTSACIDILNTMRHVLPEVKSSPLLHYNKVTSYAPSANYTEIHYCSKCEYIFPRDGQVLQCETRNCGGMVKSFMLADTKELLKSLLKSPGIMEDIQKTRRTVADNIHPEILTDIHDGELYGQQGPNTEFLNSTQDTIQLTAILNTDGVNLYSSSKVELWPVFLAINELSPSLRFSRENILLIGLWQGKGKPSFNAYLRCICEEINLLSMNGLEIEVDGNVTEVRLSVLGVTLDLPAKAGVLNMTFYNGAQACVTCEEPGKTVTQGRGHSRCYPYRPLESRFPLRSSADVLRLMNAATNQNRQKGFKGLSGLAYLLNFDLVYGTPPDYMHCVLLGVVKSLMSKWFSPVESGKE